jgi:flagellar motor switch protein FliN/FliY
MSDGALSQAEIDALLGGGTPAASGAGKGGSAASDASTIGSFLNGTVETLSASIGTMTGSSVKLGQPQAAGSDRDALLAELPDTVTAVQIDYIAGFPGEHTFLFAEDTAKAVVALMNKEENVTLDEMAMSVIGEMVSTMAGAQVTALTAKTGNKTISAAPPDAATVPKAAVALPAGSFVRLAYSLDLGDGVPHTIWELFGPKAASGMAQALRGGGTAQGAAGANAGFGNGSPIMPGGMNTFGQAPNVQSVQFPGLNTTPTLGAREQGNIGLLMDVYMEMTVELGRTRKLIKDILAMGEGTIIELDKLAGEPVDILVNRKLIAKGEVVVIDENFGVRVTEIVSPAERISEIS